MKNSLNSKTTYSNYVHICTIYKHMVQTANHIFLNMIIIKSSLCNQPHVLRSPALCFAIEAAPAHLIAVFGFLLRTYHHN